MPFVIIWLLFGICAAIVASNRGASGCMWFGLGVLLGPIGFALAFTTGAKCPKCASRISEDATVCPNCQANINKGTVDLPKPNVWRKNYCEACDVEFDQPIKTCPYMCWWFSDSPIMIQAGESRMDRHPGQGS